MWQVSQLINNLAGAESNSEYNCIYFMLGLGHISPGAGPTFLIKTMSSIFLKHGTNTNKISRRKHTWDVTASGKMENSQ